jgi:DNA polymerase-4
MNAFYASVELLEHPELADQPVAVCGDPEARHGIILAKNEAAKRCHIQTAETIWQARKKCPQLILLPAHHQKYRDYSQRINAIYEQYTDLVEPFSIDESWLDVTGSLHLFGGDSRQLADHVRGRVKAETGLTCSVGVSFNKVFAKLGSDYKKPDATTVIRREDVPAIVWPLPVTDLLFIGGAAAKVLRAYGIETIGQLAATEPDALETMLGKVGRQLSAYARGEDTSPVVPARDLPPPKSIGNGLTFRKNLTGRAEVRTGLELLSDSVATRLRKHQLKCATLQVTIRDANFKTIQRQKGLPLPTNLARELTEAALQLVEASWNLSQPVRMLTVTALNLTPEWQTVEQLDLFAPETPKRRDKLERLEKTMDTIRRKYGKSAIQLGSLSAADLTGEKKPEHDQP